MGINLGLEAGLPRSTRNKPRDTEFHKPGDFLIIQLHYHFDYSAPPVISNAFVCERWC